MYPNVLPELAWAIAQEREEEARERRPAAKEGLVPGLHIRSALARELVWIGVHLDRKAAESALRKKAGKPGSRRAA